ncbi:MAG: hypothetical protein ACTHLW_03325 [Verrucomicrobiota bacterium]
MKTRISLPGLTRSTAIFSALILAGLTLQSNASPILVGQSQLSRNQSTLPLETARALVANYNASHAAGVPDLPMPDSVTKAGRYGFSKQASKGKNVSSGSGYFLVKSRMERNRNGVQLFYAANSQDDVGGAGAGSGGAGGTGNNPGVNDGSSPPNGSGSGDTGFDGFTPNGSGQHPSPVPDSSGTLLLLGLAMSALGLVRRTFRVGRE